MGVTVGLDSIYYAICKKDDIDGVEYETPVRYAGAIQFTSAPTTNNANLYADNQLAEVATALGDIPVTLNMTDIPADIAAKLLGSQIDENGVLLSSASDNAPYVAVGFRALKSDGSYRYVWLYKGKFQPESTDIQTRGETPAFQTPTLNATFMPRKFDGQWRARLDEGEGVDQAIIDGWFAQVYEKN